MPRLLLCGLPAALWGCTVTCPTGSYLETSDGLCHLAEIEDSAASVPDSHSNTDTGDSGTIQGPELAEDCSIPVELGTDPLEIIGSIYLQDLWFAELTDIAIDPDEQVVYATGQAGIFAIDVSDPTSPVVLDNYDAPLFGNRIHQIELGPDDRLYGSHRDQGIVVMDRSSPDDLQELALTFETGFSGIATTDEAVLVVSHSGDLYVYEPEASGSLRERSVTPGVGHAWDIVVNGTDAWIGSTDLGIVHVDLTDLDQPVLSAPVDATGGVQDIVLSEDASTLYAAVGGAGLEVFSLDTPAQPQRTDLISLSYAAISIARGGETLWVATQIDVVALDLSEPRAPRLINTEETDQWAMAIAADDTHAYVADWAWVHAMTADASVQAPDLDEATSSIFLDEEGGSYSLLLHNLGSAPLELRGATVSDERLQLEVSKLTLDTGQDLELQITYEGGGKLDAELCLATNDPDEPLRSIQIVDGATGLQLGLGSEAPDFELVDLNGETHRLSDQRGHPVVLSYFSTW